MLIALVLASATSQAATRSLETELKALEVKDAVPSAKLTERIYAVQSRATPLKHRVELTVAMAQNFGGTGFLDTIQTEGDAYFHFTDRFSMAAGYAHVSNKFTSAAKNLEQKSGILPDVDYATSRMELRALYNLFYGKFRFTRNQSLSFDQYLGFGVAQHELRSGQTVGALGDFGFAFWFGQHVSMRLGVKDYYYREDRTLSQGYSHNVHGYLQTGYIF